MTLPFLVRIPHRIFGRTVICLFLGLVTTPMIAAILAATVVPSTPTGWVRRADWPRELPELQKQAKRAQIIPLSWTWTATGCSMERLVITQIRRATSSDSVPGAFVGRLAQVPINLTWSSSTRSTATPLADIIVVESGLPFRALRGRTPTPGAAQDHSLASSPRAVVLGPVAKPRIIPLSPIWSGFVANTLFYASLWSLLLFAPKSLRSHLRRRRNLCPRCAYSLLNLPPNSPCPECGHTQGS